MKLSAAMGAERDMNHKEQPEEETLEELFGKLDGILKTLEDRDTTLEDSFAAYEQGIRYLKACNDKIDRVEKQMLVMNESGGLDEF